MLKHVLLCTAMLSTVCVSATEGVSNMATQLFGKESASKRIASGAVFIDGLFIKGPYEVSREGNVILVNGRIASRFKVEAKSSSEGPSSEKAAADAKAAASDPAASGGRVSDKDGATIGGDPTPTLDDAPSAGGSTKQPSAIEARLAKKNPGGGGIDARLAAQKKAKELEAKSAVGSFNGDATGADPMALFEEADYTYTPPSKPEPKAVPYVRPAAQKSMGERMAKAKDAEVAAKAGEKSSSDGEDEDDGQIATESFDSLTEAEISTYIKRFTARRAAIEKVLEADGMILLSSASSGAKAEKKTTMWRFVSSLNSLCAAPDASKLTARWGTVLPRGYLQRIYDNRAANGPEMKTLILRVTREAKEAQQRANNRI